MNKTDPNTHGYRGYRDVRWCAPSGGGVKTPSDSSRKVRV